MTDSAVSATTTTDSPNTDDVPNAFINTSTCKIITYISAGILVICFCIFASVFYKWRKYKDQKRRYMVTEQEDCEEDAVEGDDYLTPTANTMGVICQQLVVSDGGHING